MSLFNESYLMFLGETICDPEGAQVEGTDEIIPDELNQSIFCLPDPADTQDHDSLQFQILATIGFVSLMFAAVVGNCIVMWIIYKHKVGTIYFYNFADKTVTLRHTCQATPSKGFDHMLFYIQYALPLFVLSVTFGRIAWALRNSTDANHNSTKCPSQAKSKSKAVKMLALMVITFMLFWLPYHIYHAFNFDFGQSVYLFIYWVAMSSSASNPVIYCLQNQRFRIGFRYVLRFLPCVRFEQDEYLYSQLFPERLRSMALSLHKSKDVKSKLNGVITERATFSSYNGKENSSFDLGGAPLQPLDILQHVIGQEKPLHEEDSPVHS
ncbi:hypothetical protein WR25_14649 [Diploscapter pachys]|uniref:G-protein coupled receptors family 1 profile domain-containing protein n=1 Tax=Diploscapter pachys TaxID=2018661 RepID=A0A2A2LJU7_9BILA|nr:hypothetical protein WR25_14649 [Diploscapter pachys]